MRILSAVKARGIAASIIDQVRVDYVYMYPPRQAYRTLGASVMEANESTSLSNEGPLNLYVHVPFCRQICAYCNLYAVANTRDAAHEQYIEAVCREIDHYGLAIQRRQVDTIYIGGGTPSLLQPSLIIRLLNCIAGWSGDISTVPEVALEVAPDTVSSESLSGWRHAGINRINLGVQSWDDQELASIGRRHGVDVPRRAIELALNAGFSNVCVDLIYGLEGQTEASWEASLRAVSAYRPQTICCYALTLRPRTGFASRGYHEVQSVNQYAKYDRAVEILGQAGYIQETHVRWILPSQGGYRQKANHWAGQDILGFGAGARSYLRYCDIRNGYSVKDRSQALKAYLGRVRDGEYARTDGFLMDEDERRRKRVILGLGALDRGLFRREHRIDVLDVFGPEIQQLEDCALVNVTGEWVSLTPRGLRFRDVAVQMFFSERVQELISTHSYEE